MTEPDQRQFRDVIGRFVTGVTVVTTRDDQGRPHGMTANAVTSVSLDPLLVLVSVQREATMADAVQVGPGFALSVLAADQRELSDHFADPSRPYGEAGFDGVATHGAVTGIPLLDDAVAWVDCDLHAVHDGGDHLLVVGEVRAAVAGDLGRGALLWTPDGYGAWWPTA